MTSYATEIKKQITDRLRAFAPPFLVVGSVLAVIGPYPLVSSRRTIAAPSANALSLAKAVARRMYFMPRSGAGISRSGVDCRGGTYDQLFLGLCEIVNGRRGG
jgi:hypothetical protein